MPASRNFPVYGTGILTNERVTRLETTIARLFSPDEVTALYALTKNVDRTYKVTYHCAVMRWAIAQCNEGAADTDTLKGIFLGVVHLLGLRPDGSPRFGIEHGKGVIL